MDNQLTKEQKHDTEYYELLIQKDNIARQMKSIRQETAWTFAHDSDIGCAYLADKKNQGKVYTRSGELISSIVAEIWEMDFFFSYCKHNSFNNTDRLMEEYEDLGTRLQTLQGQLKAMEGLYTGWARWGYVPGGHIHKHNNHRCHTLKPSTQYAWLPGYSGMTWEEIASSLNAEEVVCSHCVPEAPAEYNQSRVVEDDVCPGSREAPLPGGSRQGYVAGNYHTCSSCKEKVGGAGHKVRKHKVGYKYC